MTAKEIIKLLEAAGFSGVRQTGSHYIMKHADGRRANVPYHGKKDVRLGTLKNIERESCVKLK